MNPGDRYLERGTTRYATVVAVDGDMVWMRWSATKSRLLPVAEVERDWIRLADFEVANQAGVHIIPDTNRIGLAFPQAITADMSRRRAIGLAAWIVHVADPDMQMLSTALQLIAEKEATP